LKRIRSHQHALMKRHDLHSSESLLSLKAWGDSALVR
jgi:hypothetical protein